MPHTARHRISGCNPVRRRPALARLPAQNDPADEIRLEPAGKNRPALPAPAVPPPAALSQPPSAARTA